MHQVASAFLTHAVNSLLIILAEEAEVSIVNVENEVISITIEGDDFALGIWRHPLKQNALVVLDSLGTFLFVSLAAKFHLSRGNKEIENKY